MFINYFIMIYFNFKNFVYKFLFNSIQIIFHPLRLKFNFFNIHTSLFQHLPQTKYIYKHKIKLYIYKNFNHKNETLD